MLQSPIVYNIVQNVMLKKKYMHKYLQCTIIWQGLKTITTHIKERKLTVQKLTD